MSSEQRAALVDQLATAIVDIEAELNDGNPAPLAERIVAWFEAAGWGPRPEAVTAGEFRGVVDLVRERVGWRIQTPECEDSPASVVAYAVDAVLTSDVLRSRGITVEGEQ